MNSKRIELCVPANRGMLLIIRMTTSGVLSRAGLTLDEVDEVKMAIDEACNLMMLQKPACEQLAISYEYCADCVSICVEGQGIVGESDRGCMDAGMQEVMKCILESMVDEVSMDAREDGCTAKIYMKKSVPSDRRGSV